MEENKLDPMGIGKALELFPEQIKVTLDASLASNIEPLEFENVVVSGMGGSSNAAKIIESLTGKETKIPFVVHNDYGLPSWANERTLVVANSYSGNTEETLSAIDEAEKRGCKVIGVTTGGKIAEMIKEGKIKGAVVSAGNTNPSGYPKSGLGLSFGALFGALIKVGFLKYSKEDVLSSLDEIVEIRKSWKFDEFVEFLRSSIPVLFSSRSLLGPLNAGRNAICEIGRVFTLFFDFPEVNHVLVEATLKPDFAKDKIKYLFFESESDHERIKLRYRVTKDLFTEQGLSFKSLNLKGKNKLTQVLEIPHFCAWLGYYLSMDRNEDPGPEPWIIKLKESLSQPVH